MKAAAGTARAELGPRSKKRWREIVDTSARIFYEKGYDATGIQDVADAVGILKGSLYYYIDSKEDLLYAVIKEVHDGAMEVMAGVQESEGDEVTKLRRLIQDHILYEAKKHRKIAVFYHDFRSLSEGRAAEIRASRHAYEHFVRDLIAAGQQQGLVRKELDPGLTAMGIFGMLNWIYQWYRPGRDRPASQLAEEYSKILLEGLCLNGAVKRPRQPKAGAR